MKTTAFLALSTLLAAPLWAAEPADEVKSAAKKLAGQSYAWSTKTDAGQPAGGGGGGRGRGFFGGGDVSGKTDKDGTALLTFTQGENTTEAVLKGESVAVKVEDAWKSGEELTADTGDGGPNRARFLAMRVQRTKLPATEAQELVGTVKELKKDGDAYSGALSADAIKAMYTFGGRRGGNNENAGPDTSGLKGTAKFWVKDGVLTKYETKVEGKMTFRDNERDVTRTTTVEIKDIGSTKLEVPADAKKKIKA